MIKGGGKEIKYIGYKDNDSTGYIIQGVCNGYSIYKINSKVIGASELNVGDGSSYSLQFLKDDTETETPEYHTDITITSDSDKVVITNNNVRFTDEGTFTLNIKYKSYITTHTVKVYHLNIYIS